MNTQEAVAATLRITARSRSEWLSGDVRGIQTMEGAELGKPDYEDFPDKADTCQGFLLDFSRIQKRMEEVREYIRIG